MSLITYKLGLQPCATLRLKARQRMHGARSLLCSRAAAVEAPTINLEQLWEEHLTTEFSQKSADAAAGTMAPHATVNHIPVMTGGKGTEALRAFYADHFIPRMPADVKLTPIDRTVAHSTIVDEFIFEFTHDIPMDWMLPGIAPTGRKVRVPFVVVVKFEGDKLVAERIYWDQATVLVQIGVLDPAAVPAITGAEQADKAADMGSHPSNALMRPMP